MSVSLVAAWIWWRSQTPLAPAVAESPTGLLPSDPSIHAAYAGSESCRDCHKEEYELWGKSNHGLAERLVSPQQDQTAFDPARSFHATQKTETRVKDREFQITTLGFHTNIESYRVDRVIGNDPLQQFLTSAPGGRWQVHEASYDPKSNEWFNVYGNEDRQPGEYGHWTGRGMNWNSTCAECHNTRYRKNYDLATDTYRSTMAEMSVGCEACHGPMKAHVDWRKTNPGSTQPDPTITPLSSVQMLDTCGSCHSLRDNLTDDFKPGDSFFDHYSLEILDTTDRWHPDGQVHGEDYEFTSFLSSRMHAAGVRCVHCHEPHSNKLRVPGNLMCMSCHGSIVTNGAPRIDPTTHSRHKADTSGDACIDCHMPVTTYMQRDPRHDHGFTIPDPLLTKQLGIPNACNRCHKDQTVDWALEHTEKWYGEKMNRHTRERAQWLAGGRRGDASARDKLLNMTTNEPMPYWRAAALSMLWQWAEEPRVKNILLAGLKSEDPLVRQKAASSLEPLVSISRPDVVNALKAALDDPVRSVRVAAAWSLRSKLDLQSRASQELEAALNLMADQPSGQYRRAMLLLDRRQPAEALVHLRQAVAWDPFSPPLRQALADGLKRLNRHKEAIAELQTACRLQPNSAETRVSLGLAFAEGHDFEKAEAVLEEAVKLDPQLARAWFNLGLVRDARRKTKEALDALTRAEILDSFDPKMPFARASILARQKRFSEARAAAEQALKIQSDFTPARELLQRLSSFQD